MPTMTARQVIYVWLALSVLTMLSWWAGPVRAGGSLEPHTMITVFVIALAVIKCRLILQYFMEVRSAPAWLKWATDAWLVALWGGVLALYLW